MRASSALAFMLIAAMSFAQQQSTDKAVAPTSSSERTAEASQQGKKSASDPAPKPKPPSPEEKWLYPAQRVSADLESQAWRLKRDMHAVALVTLGSYWWKQDRSASGHWIYPEIDALTFTPQQESAADRNWRMTVVRRLLGLVTSLDPLAAERLRDSLRGNAIAAQGEAAGPEANWRTADALVFAAGDSQPAQQARSISEAIQYAVTPIVVDAIISLHDDLPDQATQLFQQALVRASSSENAGALSAFANILNSPDTDVPQAWRQAVATEYERVVGSGAMGQDARCATAEELSQGTAWIGSEYARVVTLISARCGLGISNPVLAADSQAIQQRDPHSVDDYLSAADEVRSPIAKYQLKVTAAEKAEEENQGGPLRALRILDNIPPEEREVNPVDYKTRRSDVAVRAAVHEMRAGCAGLNIIETSPRLTILHVAVGVAEKVSGSCYGAVMYIALNQRVPAEDPNDYVRLINLVLRRGPLPVINLQKLLRLMDEWKPRDPNTLRGGEQIFTAPWDSLMPLRVVNELFAISPEMLTAIARGSFRNEMLRTDFELLLVKGFLARYDQELAKQKAEMAAESAKP